jgi:hypothetical protein
VLDAVYPVQFIFYVRAKIIKKSQYLVTHAAAAHQVFHCHCWLFCNEKNYYAT